VLGTNGDDTASRARAGEGEISAVNAVLQDDFIAGRRRSERGGKRRFAGDNPGGSGRGGRPECDKGDEAEYKDGTVHPENQRGMAKGLHRQKGGWAGQPGRDLCGAWSQDIGDAIAMR
jgi:hypothetical protein